MPVMILLTVTNLLLLAVISVLFLKQRERIRGLNEMITKEINKQSRSINSLQKEVFDLNRSLERWKSSENEKLNVRFISERFKSLEECEKRLRQIPEENRKEAEYLMKKVIQASKVINLTVKEEKEMERIKQFTNDELDRQALADVYEKLMREEQQ